MSRGASTYQFLERVCGRAMMWRLGRWLYYGARRDLSAPLDTNGEYAIQQRMALYLASRGDPAPVVLDVGANLGAWSRPFGEALQAAGVQDARLVAFEPGSRHRTSRPVARHRRCAAVVLALSLLGR